MNETDPGMEEAEEKPATEFLWYGVIRARNMCFLHRL